VQDSRVVKEVQLLVNGRPPERVKMIKAASRPITADARDVTPHRLSQRFAYQISLPQGTQEIHLRAVAFDAADLGSDPVEIVLKRSGAKPVAGNLYVLSVGVSRYRHADGHSFNSLRYPSVDAEAIAERFQREGQPLYAREGQPLYAHVEARLLTDEHATAANVLAGLRWLQRSVRPGQVDSVVIFLSGHGISQNGHYYFATHETDLNKLAATTLSGRKLRQALGGQLAAKYVFLFVDTCHAGGLSGRNDDLALELGERVFLLASSGAREYSYESENWGHGAFTLALLRSLGKRELENEGAIRFNALTYDVPNEVAALMRQAGRNESEQEPCVPLAARQLRVKIAQAAR
jgi:hypothetical protein